MALVGRTLNNFDFTIFYKPNDPAVLVDEDRRPITYDEVVNEAIEATADIEGISLKTGDWKDGTFDDALEQAHRVLGIERPTW